ncbi:MAG: hypothetical protein JSC085_000512 [Candidatus Tokpelaia sp. JSC085]|nr:MAG: hypothetical protein JSC085_000512 [Candidatus Tokpelaia sp. JSC085]
MVSFLYKKDINELFIHSTSNNFFVQFISYP